MAKKVVKKVAKQTTKPAKKSAAPKKSKPASPTLIEKTCEAILEKLKALNLDIGLQGEIEWCLGSYRFDKNPTGLYVMAERALPVFKTARAANPKAVSPKFLTAIEKAMKSR